MIRIHADDFAPHRATSWLCRLAAISAVALLVAALRYMFYEVILVEALVRLL
jgi:hypothetical protein